ncbi:Sugar or nucleoside kinase, ribokinase family [Dethiosulfatibacter aminovorans DSM 17477]|uniref:Sugar or nucleoside kinase, ribokinase family n=1 Tax=Dethiosulfatibacter aminovorans DSM 17477 TaxID=1121476 RepID=A0A1M6GKI1_9FIRM|nr:Sugar or nucleoside kinase, ribokinase family [Dethiosulfatibacter aminovorans DSM 17477]
MIKALGIGDNVCDVYLDTNIMYPGGQALNFSVYAKQLGADSEYLGVFGQDAIAEYIQKILDEKVIGRSRCRSYEGENGFARVKIIDGDRVFKGSNKGGVLQDHFLELDEDDIEYIKKFNVVHTTNNAFFDSQLKKISGLGPFISYDFSVRWNEEDRIKRVCPYIDFAFLSCSDMSDEEAEVICRNLYNEGCKVITATRGSSEAIIYDGKKFYRQKPDYVEPVDTMGAGDSFATCMLVKIVEKIDENGMDKWNDSDEYREDVISSALQEAASFASKTCMVNGAFGCGIEVPESVQERVLEE